MQKRRQLNPLKLCLSIFIFCVASLSNAGVYKWVDEHGQVHFGDRPATDTKAEKVDVSPATSGSISSERKAKRDRLLKVFEEDRNDKKQEQKSFSQKKAERKARCEKARADLNEYQNAGYLYQMDEQGEQVILDDTAHAKALDGAREQVTAWCG